MPRHRVRGRRGAEPRGGFACGQADRDRFFEHYTGQNQLKLHLAVTYVAVIEARIVGFAAVSPASIERGSVPNPRLRRRLPSYPLPVLRLARMASTPGRKASASARRSCVTCSARPSISDAIAAARSR